MCHSVVHRTPKLLAVYIQTKSGDKIAMMGRHIQILALALAFGSPGVGRAANVMEQDPPAQDPSRAQSEPAPIGNAAEWFASAPERKDITDELTVRFAVSVFADGSIGDCTILLSSGNEAIDEATCRSIREHGTFDPARDESGERTDAVFESAVSWHPEPSYSKELVERLSRAETKGRFSYPEVALQLRHQGDVTYKVEINEEGRAENCRVIESSGHKELDDATCDLIQTRGVFRPALDNHGELVRSEFQGKMSWRLPLQ